MKRQYQPVYGPTPPAYPAASLAGNVAVLATVGLMIASAPTLAVLADIAKSQENAK